MKIINKLMIGFLLSAILIGSLSSVNAADENIVLDDPSGDVFEIDYTSEDLNLTDEKPNIDIKKVTYVHEEGSTQATIILEVYGEIENRGSLNEEDWMSMLDSVIYTILVETSSETYSISYANQDCQITTSLGSPENITGWSVNDDALTIPITLTSSDETYVDVSVETIDIKIDLTGAGGMYADMVPDESYITVEITSPSSGTEKKIGENINFKGLAEDFLGTTTSFDYEWDFGDGTTSTQQNPTHSYGEEGTYTVKLTATDDQGSSESTTISVKIASSSSPNGSTNGEDNNGSGILLFIAIIVLIALVGVAAVVYILRR